MSEAPAGQCAVHEDADAVGTCARCGNFVCGVCTEDGRFQICPPCRDRVGLGSFPFSRDRWSIGDVLGYAWAVFQKQWLMLVVGATILYFVSFLFSMGNNVLQFAMLDRPELSMAISVSVSLVQNVVNGILSLGLIAMSLDALAGREVDISQMWKQSRKIGKLLVQYLVVFAVIGIPFAVVFGVPFYLLIEGDEELGLVLFIVLFLLLIGPITYLSIGLFFMQYELVYDDDIGAIEAMKNGWKLVSGVRLEIFAVMLIGGGIMLAGFFLCCIGIVAAHPLALLLQGGVYLALRTGSDLPEPRLRK